MATHIEPIYPSKILIVDDDPDSLVAFKQAFKTVYHMLAAGSAEEALRILKENPDVAVVVSDQRMPKTTGVELLFHIKNTHPAITRVLITGYADLEAAIDAVNMGTIFKYLSKPFEPDKTRDLLMDAVSFHFKTLQSERLENHMYSVLQEKTSHAMENYTAWIAHHVNNALQSIRTFVDLASPRFAADESEKNFARTTQDYVRRLADIIQQLRNIYAHGLEHFVRGKVSSLLEFENEELKKMVQNKKITLRKEIREPELEIMADPMAIQEALRKLVMNAIEASPDGGTIEIRAAKHASDGTEEIMFSVRDQGKGISPEIKEKLFYPFLKIGSGDKIRGIGLPYVQGVVARHGGNIQIDSVMGKGTDVSISLPIIQPESSDPFMDELARQKIKKQT